MSLATLRRRQIDRTATTKGALIAATIRLIERVGYAETSTARIIEEAKVSRGALLHHFPAKADLMVEVSETVYQRHLLAYRTDVSPLGTAADRIGSLFDVAWALHQKPDAIALIEIWMATRGDADLRAKLSPFQERTYDEGSIGLVKFLPELGLSTERARACIVASYSAMRGLALEWMMGERNASLSQAIKIQRAAAIDMLLE